jgi:hypothetical protein
LTPVATPVPNLQTLIAITSTHIHQFIEPSSVMIAIEGPFPTSLALVDLINQQTITRLIIGLVDSTFAPL